MMTTRPIVPGGGRKLAACVISLALAAAAVVAVGCTPGAYRRSADLQVHELLKDRKERTLGYTPQSAAPVQTPDRPPKRAYSKIPMTAKAPPTTSPVEPEGVEVAYGPLGPAQFPPAMAVPLGEEFGIESLRGLIAQRSMLGPPAPAPAPQRFDLFASLAYAVVNSRNYQSQMEDVYLAALDVTLERHLFEPRPFASTGLRYTREGSDADYATALTVVNSLGVRQQLPYGGEVVAEALVDFVNELDGNVDDGEDATVALSASIPLLRGAGIVNLDPLIDAEREMVYAVREFEDFRRAFVVQVASQYFRLLNQQNSIINRAQNLNSLGQLVEKNQALFAAGRTAFIEVQRSLQEKLNAENRLVTSQEQYRNGVDSFKLLLGMPITEELEIVPRELDVEIPEYNNEQAVALAHRYRLDLQTARDRIEDSQRNVQVAKNGLLPDLDLTARGAISNEGDNPARRLDDDTAIGTAAITLDLPLDRLAERNAYRRSLIQLERNRRAFEQLEDEVATDAREALRGIRSSQIALEIQRGSIDLAQRRLENANELLRLGRRESRDVVEAQNALLNAQDNYDEALADLQIQVLEFLRDTGTLRVDPQAGSVGHALNREAVTEAVQSGVRRAQFGEEPAGLRPEPVMPGDDSPAGQ